MAQLYTPQNFAFALEMKIYLRPKKTETARMLTSAVGWSQDNASVRYHRTKLRQVAKLALDFSQVPCTTKRGAPVWDKWLIDEDPSLAEGEGHSYWGVQLVSPVLHTDGNWQDGLRLLYSSLRAIFDIKAARTCSTNIHISPRLFDQAGYAIEDIHNILAANSVPSNITSDKLALTHAASDPYGHRPKHDNMDLGGRTSDQSTEHGTVYIRVPPAAADVGSLMHWTAWTVSFMAAAGHANWDVERPTGQWKRRGQQAPIKLNHFLLHGYALLPPSVRDGLDIARLLKQDAVPRQLLMEDDASMASKGGLQKRP